MDVSLQKFSALGVGKLFELKQLVSCSEVHKKGEDRYEGILCDNRNRPGY